MGRGVLPYLGMVGRFHGDDPHFCDYQSDLVPIVSRNSDTFHSVSHMYVTILQLLILNINNLLFLTSTIYRYVMIFMVMAALKDFFY